MEKKDEGVHGINGVEGVVIHNDNIVLGMQQPIRWYTLENGENACLIKTLGGGLEKEDENNSRSALLREVFEEVNEISQDDIRITRRPVFSKSIKMKDLNPFDKQNDLDMTADFYVLKITKNEEITPNDLPALIEIPLEEFVNLEFGKPKTLDTIEQYIIKNKKASCQLPEVYSLFVPEEVRAFLEERVNINVKIEESDVER